MDGDFVEAGNGAGFGIFKLEFDGGDVAFGIADERFPFGAINFGGWRGGGFGGLPSGNKGEEKREAGETKIQHVPVSSLHVLWV
jgi:hypothetical protein